MSKSYIVNATFEFEAESEAEAEDAVFNASIYDDNMQEIMCYINIDEVKEVG